MVAVMNNKKCKIRTGDQVVVITGREKGRTGEVREVRRDEGRVIVQGVNMVTKHFRPSQEGGGRIEQIEAALHISNVAHIDPGSDGKATRIRIAMSDGVRTRIAKKSGTAIPVPTVVGTAAKKKADAAAEKADKE